MAQQLCISYEVHSKLLSLVNLATLMMPSNITYKFDWHPSTSKSLITLRKTLDSKEDKTISTDALMDLVECVKETYPWTQLIFL